ncbi:hypothetical protein MD484_g7245, partial [Candolleomyces efflorescens]
MAGSGRKDKLPTRGFIFKAPTGTQEILRMLEPLVFKSSQGGHLGVSLSNLLCIQRESDDASYGSGFHGASRAIRIVETALDLADNRRSWPPSSVCVNIDIWHPDAISFVSTCGREGDPGRVGRTMWIPDIFMRRLQAGGEWSFICPSESSLLVSTSGDQFDAEYCALELGGKSKFSMKARALWQFMVSALRNGAKFSIVYRDAVNRAGYPSMAVSATVTSTEILQSSSEGDSAFTTHAAIVLPSFVRAFKSSPMAGGVLLFDVYGTAPTHSSKDWNALRKKVSKGTANASVVAYMPTDDANLMTGCQSTIEPLRRSVRFLTPLLAVDVDVHDIYTTLSRIYPILSLFLAASIPLSLLIKNMAGEILSVNRLLVGDLEGLGLWTEGIRNSIIATDSIQDIDEIPTWVRELYKTAAEIDPKTTLLHAADRRPFTCQGQSMTIHLGSNGESKLSDLLVTGWNLGLKVGLHRLTIEDD